MGDYHYDIQEKERPSDEPIPDLDSLIEKYGDTILRTCFIYLKDTHMAQDAVQDTFIKVYCNYSTLRNRSEEKTWITRIAINVCKNYLRTSWWKRVDLVSELEHQPIDDDNSIPGDDTLLKSIMNLKPKYREVIALYYYQELKIWEITEILKVPEGTVSVRLKRARDMLKTKLKGWYYDE